MTLHDLTTDDSLIGDLARYMDACERCELAEPMTDNVHPACDQGVQLLAIIRRTISTRMLEVEVRAETDPTLVAYDV